MLTRMCSVKQKGDPKGSLFNFSKNVRAMGNSDSSLLVVHDQGKTIFSANNNHLGVI